MFFGNRERAVCKRLSAVEAVSYREATWQACTSMCLCNIEFLAVATLAKSGPHSSDVWILCFQGGRLFSKSRRSCTAARHCTRAPGVASNAPPHRRTGPQAHALRRHRARPPQPCQGRSARPAQPERRTRTRHARWSSQSNRYLAAFQATVKMKEAQDKDVMMEPEAESQFNSVQIMPKKTGELP